MKNIHVLPTDKPSRLYEGNLGELVIIQYNSPLKSLNIYITNDEEIKEGDWYISILENEVYKATKETQNIMSVANLIGTTSYKKTHFKIILTTDQDLIKDGVQAIDDEFLEWFVKNPSCEEVEVTEYLDGGFSYGYKIIIPKEETNCCIGSNGVSDPKLNEVQLNQPKQEILEEETIAQKIKFELGLIAMDYQNGVQTSMKVFYKVLENLLFEAEKEQDKNKFSEEDMIEASKYGYNFHKTTQFTNQEFEDNCIRNTQQWVQNLKTN